MISEKIVQENKVELEYEVEKDISRVNVVGKELVKMNDLKMDVLEKIEILFEK